MINYKQILEAINRGINLALDDFDDELVGQQTLTIKNTHYTKEYLDLMNEVVDLGLPSKTLWCKYNLGVDSNLLSKDKDWCGDFYAWGEIESNKPKYDMESYKFGNGSGQTDEITKYVTSEKFICNPFNDDSEILTLVDNLTELQEKDDAAYLNKKVGNYKFHIPTKELFEELKKYTTYNKGVLKYKGTNFLSGGIFTSKINGEELFFPFTGYKNIDGNVINEYSGYYWSSTLNTKNNTTAYYLNIYNWGYIDSNRARNIGFKIRPVINL